MVLSARLLGRQYLGGHGLRPIFVSQCRNVSIQPRPADLPIEEGHDQRNIRLGRPQSPHMTIFKWQLPAVLSITHRFTGIILSGYATTFAAVSLLSNKPMGEIINNISQCYPNFFLCFKIGLLFPFSYHFYNGMRHLVWDGGKSLSLKGVYTSGYIMLLAAGVSGIALLFMCNLKLLKWKVKKIKNAAKMRNAGSADFRSPPNVQSYKRFVASFVGGVHIFKYFKMVRSKKAVARDKSPGVFSENKRPQRSRSRSAASSKKGKPYLARSKSRSRKRAQSKSRGRPKTRSRSRSKSKSPFRRGRARSRSRSRSEKNTPITRTSGRSATKKVDPAVINDLIDTVEQKKPSLGYRDVLHDDFTSKESKLNEIIRRSISRELSQEKSNTYRIPPHKSLLTNFKEEPRNIDGMNKKESLISLPKKNRLIPFAEWLRAFLGITVFPFAVLMLHLLCSRSKCSVEKFHFPRNWKYYLNLEAAEMVSGFVLVQAIFQLLPIGKRVDGPPGINGTLQYRCNGLLSTLLTVAITAVLWHYKIPVTIVYDKLISLVVSSVILGYILGLLLFVKGGRAPVPGLNPEGIIGSRLNQFFVGREINPTLFGKLNLKTLLVRTCLNGALVLNGLLVLKAYETKHELSYGLLICFALNVLLVIDFFWFENNYPLTFEAMHQGTGCSLTLGYLLYPFLPALITKYIILQKVELPVWGVVAVIVGFTVGFVIYRASSLQKAAFRKCPLNPALTQLEAISTNRGKKLLVSGWWGWVRHPNYLGTIIFYWAWASVAGYGNAAPYAVPIIATALLIFRAKTVDTFCSKRYQSAWDEYCSRVRYRIFPRVY